MKWFDNTALTLVIIGAINWLLVGIFRFDLVAFLFGNLSWLSPIRNHLYAGGIMRFLPDQFVWKNRHSPINKGLQNAVPFLNLESLLSMQSYPDTADLLYPLPLQSK